MLIAFIGVVNARLVIVPANQQRRLEFVMIVLEIRSVGEPRVGQSRVEIGVAGTALARAADTLMADGQAAELHDIIDGAALPNPAVDALWRRLRGREGMGGGDPKLLGGIGAWVGALNLPFILLGAGLLGLAAALLMRLRGQAVTRTTRLPLGALMAVAAWPVWLIVAT